MRHTLAALLLAAACGIAPAMAQTLPTPRSEREPNPAAVQQRERALGIAPGQAQQRQDDQTLNHVFRDLTGQNPNAPASAAPPPPGNTPAQDARTENRLYRDLTGQSPATSR